MNGITIDWTWFPDKKPTDCVWLAGTPKGGMLIASNMDFDALFIGDSEQEVIEEASKHKAGTLGDDQEGIVAKPTTLHSLSTSWRWFIYKGKARFLCGGRGWHPITIGEYPGFQARIAPDPVAMCYYALDGGQPVRMEGAIIVESSVVELVDELHDLGMDGDPGMDFGASPLFSFVNRSPQLWYRGRKHDLAETLQRNIPLFARFMTGEPMTGDETKGEDE